MRGGQGVLISMVLAIAVMSHGVSARSGGADPAACSDMMPRHGGSAAQTSNPPFEVTVSKTTYTSGDTVTVTLDAPCSDQFRGFMIQALDAEDVSSGPIGSFNNPSGTRYMAEAACGSDTKSVTHTEKGDKSRITLVWTAPGSSTAHIVFAVTFVKNFPTFWVRVFSPAVTLTGAGALSPNGTFPTPSTCGPTDQAPQTGTIPADAECGASKSCFVDCDANDQCTFIASWKPEGDNIVFELKGSVPSGDEKWIALGFSSDSKMGDDTVLECAVGGGNMESYFSKNLPGAKANNREKILPAITVSMVNNVLSCQGSISKTNNDNMFDTATKYTLFFATGDTQTGSTVKKIHGVSPLPAVSTEVADLLSSTQLIGGQAPSNILARTHGSLMITAWVLLASFGLVVARYYKKLGGSRRLGGLHIWFQLHRVAMILIFVLSAIGFIIIFVDVRGYSEIGRTGNMGFLQAHPILGIISTFLVVLNPMLAVCRPHPGTKNRPLFNWVHWGVGTVAWIISIVTIFLGFEIEKVGVDPVTKYVLAGFVAYQLLVELILEVHGCLQSSDKQAATDDYEMKNANGKTPEVARHSTMQTGSSGAGVFKTALLVAHGIILVAFLIAILYFVNAPTYRNKEIIGAHAVASSGIGDIVVVFVALRQCVLVPLPLDETNGIFLCELEVRYEMKNANGKTPDVARHSTMQTGSSGAGVFKTALLVAHGIILVAFLIAILYFVNAPTYRNKEM